jgi:histone demethylase JARID1
MRLRHSDEDLERTVSEVAQIADAPIQWVNNFLSYMSGSERPSLKTLQQLLSDAERIDYRIPEADDLKFYVRHAFECVEIANKQFLRRHKTRHVAQSQDCELGTLALLEDVLQQIKDLHFDAPEIELLNKLLENVQEFQKTAQVFLRTEQSRDLESIERMCTMGRALNVGGIKELEALDGKGREIKWIAEAKASLEKTPHYAEVVGLREGARGIGIPAGNELVLRLEQLKASTDGWSEKVNNLLERKHYTVADLQGLLEESELVPVLPSQIQLIRDVFAKISDWVRKATALLDYYKDDSVESSLDSNAGLAKGGPKRKKVYSLGDARKLLKEGETLPVEPEELTSVKTMLKKCETWLARCKRAVNKGTGHQKSVAELLYEVYLNCDRVCRSETESATAVALDHPSEGGKAVVEAKVPAVEPVVERYCICQSSEGGFMVECDICKECKCNSGLFVQETWYLTVHSCLFPQGTTGAASSLRRRKQKRRPDTSVRPVIQHMGAPCAPESEHDLKSFLS